MRDAEVAQVGDQPPRRLEPESGGQLETVGGSELGTAQATRFRITIECAITSTSVRAPKLALPASASGCEVETSSAHWAPYRRRGSMTARTSWLAMVCRMHESSQTVVRGGP